LSGNVLLAAVMGAQGLKGAVKVKTFTADPEALSRYGVLHDVSGRRYEITAFRTGKPGEAVISFKSIATREAAEALRGTELFVPRGNGTIVIEPRETLVYILSRQHTRAES
jgi:16S rRNA processing protein RimM